MRLPASTKDHGVLVTGAGGFIGRHLVADQLERGRRVVATDLHLDALESLASSPDLELVQGDIGDRPLQRAILEGVSTVFHLAATHLSVRASAADYRRVNVEAVGSLIRHARDAGVRRFVHCSTVGVYGPLPHIADETTPCRPEFEYEKTKLEGESVVLDVHRSDDVAAVVLRPAWVYGPGCPRTEKLFKAIERGRFLVAGKGDTFRHCLYIRDMVKALELAARVPGAVGQVLIIADEEAVTIRELVDRIAALSGKASPVRVPFALMRAAARVSELGFGLLRREPPLTRRSLRFFTGNTSFRTDRARELLGFQADYSLAQGLAETQAHRRAGRFWAVPLPEVDPAETG
jgi:nucleoside-diphosphate-sugar epimerase